MPQKDVTVRTLMLSTEIASTEVPLLRGAMLRLMNYEADTAFHDHDDDGAPVYVYPLVQYKRLGRRAAIVGIDGGAHLLDELTARLPEQITLGRRTVPVAIKHDLWQTTATGTTATMQRYRLTRWLPLNQDNYEQYQQTAGPTQRIEMLQGILCGNLLSMLKGLGITAEEHIDVRIDEMGEPYRVPYKGLRMEAFDITFACNLQLPRAIGIGKGVSRGFGTLHYPHQH